MINIFHVLLPLSARHFLVHLLMPYPKYQYEYVALVTSLVAQLIQFPVAL